MPDKTFRFVNLTTQIIILVYSLINSSIQLNCILKPGKGCQIYKAEYSQANPNLFDELTLFTFLVICLVALVNIAQLIKNKAVIVGLIIAQIGLIIFQKLVLKVIIPY